jgi:hypothetical protein
MMKKYELIHPPCSLNFEELTKEQAREYFNWYLEKIPIRVQILANYVSSFPEYTQWKTDFLPNSLAPLGTWFVSQVTTRQRSDEEIQRIYSKAPAWFSGITIPREDLSVLAVSISMDIGMYVGQIMLNAFSDLSWKLITKSKNHVDFQQPVLSGKGKLHFNPFRIMLTYAYGIIDGTQGSDRLRELYDIWSYNLNDE